MIKTNEPRWTVKLTYRYAEGPRTITLRVEELFELQDIVECGPSFYSIISIEVVPSDRCPKVTVEGAKQMTDENFQNLALSESFERVAKVAEERAAFNAGIEAAAKPDPLVEVLKDFGGFMPDADDFRAALEARGLEIREKGG